MPPPLRHRLITGHWPGEPALWSLLGADMMLFGLMFVVYVHDRMANLAQFRAAQAAMNQPLGLANTLLLLTSSWCIASAVHRTRAQHMRTARWLIAAALACAAAFCAIKVIDYREKLSAGLTPLTNLFLTYYFALTGIHLVHVLVAITAMTVALVRCRRPALRPNDTVLLESAASFWHLVDIIWIMLFALFYLMQ
jgi:nitric oxide reductase NorE protein